MANLFDYLDWRGDIPFSVDPFNEVDNLILSELAYIDFEGIVPGPTEISHGTSGMNHERTTGTKPGADGPASRILHQIPLREAALRFWELHTSGEIERSGTFYKKSPYLLKKMCSGARFGEMRLAGYVNRISFRKWEQMSAVTCFLDDGTAYVSFRGTDDTMIGWKEDLCMSFMKETPGQKSAAEYLSENLQGTSCPLRIGGHSKGGNFAVYAAAFCRDDVRGRIIDVFTNDGPGFLNEVISAGEYQEILPLIHSIVPEESLFGLILETGYPHKVVKSSRKGILQHDALSWMVRRNRFEKAPALSERSILAEKALETWINEMTPEERRETVDILFSLIDESGVENLSEITMDQLHRIPDLFRAYREMDKKDRQFLRNSFRKLLRTGAASLTEDLQEKLARGTGGDVS